MVHRMVLALGLCLGLLAGSAHADNGIAGDANCDSAVDVLDAQAILQYEAELVHSLPCPANADVTHGGAVTSADALLILQYDAGLIHGF